RRYTIRAKAEGKEFIVEGIENPRRLPTFQRAAGILPAEQTPTEQNFRPDAESALNEPAVAAAIKVVLDRLHTELAVVEKTGFISYFLIVGDFIRYGRSKG